MIKLRYIIKSTLISAIIVFFTACGGGDGSFFNAYEKVNIDVSCVNDPDSTDIDTYITILSGDTLVKENNNTTVSIYHDINNLKKICISTGSAYLLRR